MIRSIIAVCTALLLCAPSAARAEWREASSRHFLVYSEGSAESVRAFATKLEKFDKAMRLRLGLGDSDLGPANRVTVYVVDDVRAVQRLARQSAKPGQAGVAASTRAAPKARSRSCPARWAKAGSTMPSRRRSCSTNIRTTSC